MYNPRKKPKMKSTHIKTLLALAGLCSLSQTAMAQKEFRILYVCKPNYNIPGYGSYSMTEAEINAARTAYNQTFPQMIKDATGNQVNVRPTFIVMPRTFTSSNRSRGTDPTARPTVWPVDMPADDMTEYFGTFARGWYDQVQNYNAIADFQYVNSGWFETDASVSWSSLNRRTDLGYNQDALAGAWHEWLHGWETYYNNYCGFDNGDADVHNPAPFGYTTANSGGLPNWMGYYRDITIRAINGGTAGWGSAAWNTYGTPRTRYTDTAPTLANNAYYRIEARHSSRPLNVSGGGSNNGAPVIQYNYSTGTSWNEQFKRVDLGGGYFALRPRHSNAAVEVPSGNNNNSAPVQQYAYSGGTNQQWSATYKGNGHFGLINRQSGKGMDLSGGNLAAGGSVIQWGSGGSDNEQFRLITVQ